MIFFQDPGKGWNFLFIFKNTTSVLLKLPTHSASRHVAELKFLNVNKQDREK